MSPSTRPGPAIRAPGPSSPWCPPGPSETRLCEIRLLSGPARELRIDRAGAGKKIISGYAATWEHLSKDLGGFREKVRRGAFARALRGGADVRCLVNHNPDLILGRSKSGTLRLSEDQVGLRFHVDVPDDDMGLAYYNLVARGDLDGCSFRFYTLIDEWTHDPKIGVIRTLVDLDIDDVSICSYPAYPASSCSARAAGDGPSATPIRDRCMRRLRTIEAEL